MRWFGRPAACAELQVGAGQRDPARLVHVWHDLQNRNVSRFPWAPADFHDFRTQATAFDEDGYPRHTMGVADCPGLYFPALPGKDTFLGLTHDAWAIAEAIGANVPDQRATRQRVPVAHSP